MALDINTLSASFESRPICCRAMIWLVLYIHVLHLGTTRTNEAMHAVLESQLGDDEKLEGEQVVRNSALIHYLATLANSNNFEDKFDYDFVESLINNGADVNSKDKSGQTVFHEVARSWNIDVARFLIKHGRYSKLVINLAKK